MANGHLGNDASDSKLITQFNIDRFYSVFFRMTTSYISAMIEEKRGLGSG